MGMKNECHNCSAFSSTFLCHVLTSCTYGFCSRTSPSGWRARYHQSCLVHLVAHTTRIGMSVQPGEVLKPHLKLSSSQAREEGEVGLR